jgi:hypothetical protein
MNQQKLPSN